MANHHLRPSPPAAPTTSTLSPIEMRRPACFETMFVPKKTECFHDFCLVAQPSASPDLLMQQCTQGEVLRHISARNFQQEQHHHVSLFRNDLIMLDFPLQEVNIHLKRPSVCRGSSPTSAVSGLTVVILHLNTARSHKNTICSI